MIIRQKSFKKIGNSYYILIPNTYFKNKDLDVKKEYDITLIPSPQPHSPLNVDSGKVGELPHPKSDRKGHSNGDEEDFDYIYKESSKEVKK